MTDPYEGDPIDVFLDAARATKRAAVVLGCIIGAALVCLGVLIGMWW